MSFDLDGEERIPDWQLVKPALPEFGDPSSLLPGLDVLYAAAPQPLLDAAAMTEFMITPLEFLTVDDRVLTPLDWMREGRPVDDDHRPVPRPTVAAMTRRPDLFLLNLAFDVTGVHGHVFRDPPSTVLRQVIVRSTDTGNICEPAHGDTRDGWEPFLEETRWLIALTRPDSSEERS